MMLVCLREKHHPAVPEHLVDKRLGVESVVDPTNRDVLAFGESLRLSGDPDEIEKWFELAGRIWISVEPATGRWLLKDRKVLGR